MATLLTYTVSPAAGTITFDLRDFVPSLDMPALTGVYSADGSTITINITDIPSSLLVAL